MVTDLKFNLKSAEKDSPLKGKCHTGFFDGMFSTFLSELSVNKTIATLIPFRTVFLHVPDNLVASADRGLRDTEEPAVAACTVRPK